MQSSKYSSSSSDEITRRNDVIAAKATNAQNDKEKGEKPETFSEWQVTLFCKHDTEKEPIKSRRRPGLRPMRFVDVLFTNQISRFLHDVIKVFNEKKCNKKYIIKLKVKKETLHLK